MLSKLTIKNFILIDELELELSDGLNIITGETGAGKSILINAIDIAFGAKTGKEVIKSGTDKAIIEITIINKKQDLSELFSQYEIDNIGEEIILTREITPSANKVRINGTIVNQEFMRIFREMFLDIHSQHQTYSFLQPKFHIQLLDSYAKNTCSKIMEQYKDEYNHYKNMIKALEELKNTALKTSEQIDFLRYQTEEIENANIIDSDEDEKLENELNVLENSEKLKELTGSSFWSLSGDDSSIIEALFQIKSNLSKASSMDSTITELETEFADIIDKIKTISSSLRDYSSSMESNEERLNEIQERLFLLDKLKRKYGGVLENVIKEGIKFRTELDNIEFSTQNIEKAEKDISDKKIKLENLAQKLSEERKNYAKVLSTLIIEKLEKLELPKVRFEIDFKETELSPNGKDKVEFLISTNISEDLKPLAKVASGGEISRVMLAIKSIFAQSDNIDTVIFDEIDTGISGKTSQSVAEEVKELSKYMQILMITHQAIIASKASRHIYVQKTQDGKTQVNISILNEKDRLNALAELASGEVSQESLNLAQRLIEM